MVQAFKATIVASGATPTIPSPLTRPAIVVDTLAVALEIALEGRGVALVNGPYADDDLATGRLVQPVQHQVTCPGAWGVICRHDAYAVERVKVFMDWLGGLATLSPQV
jgi:LysR family glycine cleavage system transcriptional activator